MGGYWGYYSIMGSDRRWSVRPTAHAQAGRVHGREEHAHYYGPVLLWPRLDFRLVGSALPPPPPPPPQSSPTSPAPPTHSPPAHPSQTAFAGRPARTPAP